jgi:hypothetical protein
MLGNAASRLHLPIGIQPQTGKLVLQGKPDALRVHFILPASRMASPGAGSSGHQTVNHG